MVYPLGSKKTKTLSVFIVLILTFLGGVHLIEMQTPPPTPLNLQEDVITDELTPEWKGVAGRPINLTENSIAIAVCSEYYGSASDTPINAAEGLEALTEIAETDINQYCESNGLTLRFDFVPFPVQADLETLIEATDYLEENGVRLVIGYDYTTTKVFNHLAEKDMFFISPGLTTTRLTDDPDNLYGVRPVIPDGEVVPSILRSKSIKALVVLQNGFEIGYEQHGPLLEDTYNEIADLFVSGDGIIYKRVFYPQPSIISSMMEENEDYTQYLAEADAAVGEALQQYGEGKVGVLVVGFGEAHVLAYQSKDMEHLLNVPWFMALEMGDARMGLEAGECTSKAKFYSSREIVEHPETLRALEERVNQKLLDWGVSWPNYTLEPYDGIKYDACWLMALSVIEANSSEPSEVKAVFGVVSSSYDGINGNYALDEHGDKAHFLVGVTEIVDDLATESYISVQIGTYNSVTDEVTYHEARPII